MGDQDRLSWLVKMVALSFILIVFAWPFFPAKAGGGVVIDNRKNSIELYSGRAEGVSQSIIIDDKSIDEFRDFTSRPGQFVPRGSGYLPVDIIKKGVNIFDLLRAGEFSAAVEIAVQPIYKIPVKITSQPSGVEIYINEEATSLKTDSTVSLQVKMLKDFYIKMDANRSCHLVNVIKPPPSGEVYVAHCKFE